MQNTLKIKQTKTALVFNLAIIACEIAAIIIVFFKIGCYPLVYYTEDSNLFALVACAVMAGVVSFELTARGFGDRCSTS